MVEAGLRGDVIGTNDSFAANHQPGPVAQAYGLYQQPPASLGALTSGSRARGAGFARVVVSCLMASLTLGLACAAAASSALPAGFGAATWKASDLTSGGDDLDVSCPSTMFCAAVSDLGHAFTFNGTSWSKSTTVGNGDIMGPVSCANATFCVVTGTGKYRSDIVTFNGRTWSGPKAIDRSRSMGAVLQWISCPSATFCAAVNQNGAVLTLKGTTWSRPVLIDKSGGGLNAVSCVSAVFCAAVDGNGNAQVFNGSRWSRPVDIDANGDLDSISCPEPNFCVAVDGGNDGASFTYNGSRWSKPVSIDRDKGGLTEVSCTSATFCMAVDGIGKMVMFNGSTWSAPVLIDPAGEVWAVSCAQPSFCVAADGRGYALVHKD